ncbi:hypothetical protein YB2330_000147 [Saitoella coloradoensis]
MHPRSSELSYSVNGTFLTGIFPEDGTRLIMNTITVGEATIIPAGSKHFQTNLGCETVEFASGFPSEDPGVLQIAQGLAMFEDDILLATFGLSKLLKLVFRRLSRSVFRSAVRGVGLTHPRAIPYVCRLAAAVRRLAPFPLVTPFTKERPTMIAITSYHHD